MQLGQYDSNDTQCRWHFLPKTLLYFTPKSPMGNIAFGQGEIQSKLVQTSPNGLFWSRFD